MILDWPTSVYGTDLTGSHHYYRSLLIEVNKRRPCRCRPPSSFIRLTIDIILINSAITSS